eukprot:CAMPEP_0174831164 /NCGR_PEP_ID=MMETSP1114-20130205/2945_1 /TAXON_ID=312471 /ORGANISM="Neobodo designis, Strain CCAP 1951/1" /LENGTH=88 /DNA_ID=CAMNT_0016064985 /DNA_START=205 /DNA_END=468 /DNA_ORIENTATION=-
MSLSTALRLVALMTHRDTSMPWAVARAASASAMSTSSPRFATGVAPLYVSAMVPDAAMHRSLASAAILVATAVFSFDIRTANKVQKLL